MNYGFVKCAISNFNSELSNPLKRLQKIKDIIIKADSQKVKLLVFPELCLTGYSCQDLFEYSDLRKSTMEALKELVEFSNAYDIVFTVGVPIEVSNCLYNCAIVIYSRKSLWNCS